MEVRIATFNIYWFPSSTFIGNQRSEEDLRKIQEVIRRLDSDILVFEEILDLQALEHLIADVMPERTYSLKDQDGHWAASATTGNGMKVALAFDRNKLEVLDVGAARLAGQPPATQGKRDPVVARLRPLGGGPSFMVIGVHFKSGDLTVGPPVTSADFDRQKEVANLSEWIRTTSPITPGNEARPKDEPTVLIGDFNAVRGNAALVPFAPGGDLATWPWPQLRFATAMLPQPVEFDPPLWDRWTTHLDRKIIDHVIVSPEVNLTDGPWAYAFDHDESWLHAAGVTEAWLEEPDYIFTPEDGDPAAKENLHHITDHRPVRVTVKID